MDTHDPDIEATASADEDRVERSQEAKLVLQRIIDEIGPRLAHRSPDAVRDQLVTAIAAAGLPEQPRPWVDSAVNELAGGRGLVMDARFEAPVERTGPSDPESQ
jgi:hypothetical protein